MATLRKTDIKWHRRQQRHRIDRTTNARNWQSHQSDNQKFHMYVDSQTYIVYLISRSLTEPRILDLISNTLGTVND